MRAPGVLSAALILFLITLPSSAGRAADAAHPLDRTLRLDVWGGTLNAAAREIKAQTGVEILFYLPDLSSQASADNVYIVTGRVSLGTVMEALARRFGFRYRVAGSGRVEVSRGYGWVGAEPALRFTRMDRLIDAGNGGPEATRHFLGEFLKPLPLLGGDFSLTLEPYPTAGNPASLRGLVLLPPVLADYLDRAVACLSGDSGDYPPARPGPAGRLFARARDFPPDWQRLLARPVPPAQGRDLRAVLLDVATAADIAVVLRAPPSRDAVAVAEAPGARPGLGQVTGEAAALWGLGKRVFLACGAVVFELGAENGYETDARSRELFWDGLAVAGFDARAAAERAGGGPALTAAIRRDVFSALWRDPVCALAYSPATGRLAVVAPLNVMREVAARLEQ